MSDEPTTVIKVFLEEAALSNPTHQFEIMEVPFADLEQFLQAVAEDRLICGTRLYTTKLEAGVYGVVARYPIAIRGRAVLRADLPRGRYIESGDD